MQVQSMTSWSLEVMRILQLNSLGQDLVLVPPFLPLVLPAGASSRMACVFWEGDSPAALTLAGAVWFRVTCWM